MGNEAGEGEAGATASGAHANTSSPETFDIADASRLHHDAFQVADFDQRGQHFSGDHPASSRAPDDDRLTADVAAWRAGAAARNEYAQAQPPGSAHDTTHVEHSA